MPPPRSPSASSSGPCCWPGRCGSRSRARRTSRGWCGPTSGAIGGFVPSSFVSAGYPNPHNVFLALGRIRGGAAGVGGLPRLGPARRPAGRRCCVLSRPAAVVLRLRARRCAPRSRWAQRHGQWEPAWVFAHIPVIENVIVQRFMARRLPGRRRACWRSSSTTLHRPAARLAGRAGRIRRRPCVALVPVAATFGPRLPFTMRPVVAAPLVHRGGADPAARDACCSRIRRRSRGSSPPWRGRRSNRMHYSQAGGGGPQGVAHRAGSAAAGFEVLGHAGLRRRGSRRPPGRRRSIAAVRHALAVWQVTTVVIATDPAAPTKQLGQRPHLRGRLHDGRPGAPAHRVQAGAWVWDDVQLGAAAPLRPARRHARIVCARGPMAARGGRWPPWGCRIASR